MEGRDPAVDPYEAPVPQEFKKVSPQAPDLNEVRRSRKDQSPSAIGPGVLELCAGADVVFLALHGSCGEDGRIQAALDLLGVPYTGAGCLASAIAMDKDMTKRLVSGLVTTPRWETVTVTADNLEELVEQTPLPAVVKPIASGSSIGVTIAHDRAALRRGLEESMALGGRTVLEQYIKGREIQVAVLDGKALPSIEIIPQADFYDYENKYQPGAAKEVCPSEIPPEWEEKVGQAARRWASTTPRCARPSWRSPSGCGRKERNGPWKPLLCGSCWRRWGGPSSARRPVWSRRSPMWTPTAGTSTPAPCSSPWWGSALTATPTSTPPWRGERRAASPSGSGRAIGRTAFILR